MHLRTAYVAAVVVWLVCLGPLSAVVAASGPRPIQLTADQRVALGKGEVVTEYWKLPGAVGSGWAAAVVPAPPSAVFAVIAAVERYPEFTPRMTEARITRRDTDSYDFYYKIHMPWPLSDHECVTKNVHQSDPKQGRYLRRWTLLRGTFERNDGYWQVAPWPAGGSLLIYAVVLKPKVSAPDFVLNYITRVALPRSVKNMRERVLALSRTASPTR